MHVVGGRYELLEQIGSGGMGTVWRARDRDTGEEVAVKLLRDVDAESVLRFVREQSLRIQHPHVVAPRGWVARDDEIAYAMDLVRGGSLADLLLDCGPLPSSYVAVLLDQILDALAAIHWAGVVHRDIKPANLLLEPTGGGRPFVRIADFGVARSVDGVRLTQAGVGVGTSGFAAPEQTRGAPDQLSDLYAVGMVGRVLLTGQRPADLPAEHDSPLWPLLLRLSAADPADRPRSAAAARAELAPLLPDGTPWQQAADPPEVFTHISSPAPAAPTQSVQMGAVPMGPVPMGPVAGPGSGDPGGPSPRVLKIVMAASLGLAAIVIVLILWLLVG